MENTELANGKKKFIATSTETNFLFWPLAMLAIFIQDIMVETKLT